MGYRWVCLTCKSRNLDKIYEGESSRSARIRGAEHIKDLEKKKISRPLYKHLEHKGETVKFKMEITQNFKDALTRQANESVRISSRLDSELLNSKNEFHHPPVARVMIENGKQKRSKFTNIWKPT